MNIENPFNNISRMDLLRTFGLGPRPRDYVIPAIALFSTGALLGAGITLLFAPKSGSKLREDLNEQLHDKLEDLGHRLERLAAKLHGEARTEHESGGEPKHDEQAHNEAA